MGIAMRKTTTAPGTPPEAGAAASTADTEVHRCDGCGRLPLIGESIASYKNGTLRCDLCRSLHHREQPIAETLVRHAPDGPHARVRVIRRLPA